MTSYLETFGKLFPVYWAPAYAAVLLVFTVLAWCIPSWRGNAVSAVFGFFLSLAGIRLGTWLAQTQPGWLNGVLRQLQREAPHPGWIDLRPHMGRMFLTFVIGGFCYVAGMVLAKMALRFWIRRWGGNQAESRPVLSPFH